MPKSSNFRRLEMMFEIHDNMDLNDTFALEVHRVPTGSQNNAHSSFTWSLCLHPSANNYVQIWRIISDGTSCTLDETQIEKTVYWDYDYQDNLIALGILRRFKPEYYTQTLQWIKTAVYEAFGPIHREYITKIRTRMKPDPFPILSLVPSTLNRLESQKIIKLRRPINELETWSQHIAIEMNGKKLGQWVHPVREEILYDSGYNSLRNSLGASRAAQ